MFAVTIRLNYVKYSYDFRTLKLAVTTSTALSTTHVPMSMNAPRASKRTHNAIKIAPFLCCPGLGAFASA